MSASIKCQTFRTSFGESKTVRNSGVSTVISTLILLSKSRIEYNSYNIYTTLTFWFCAANDLICIFVIGREEEVIVSWDTAPSMSRIVVQRHPTGWQCTCSRIHAECNHQV